MNNKYFKMLPVLLACGFFMAGCAGTTNTNESSVDTKTSSEATVETTSEAIGETTSETSEQTYFSDRDLSGEVDTENTVEIKLNGDSITADSDAVSIEGSRVTITKEGSYILSGTLNDGSVIVNTSKEEKVQLILNGVTINSDSFAPIYVAQADKVFITLQDGTNNTLSNGGSFSQIDDNNVDAVIFSKDDLTLNGSGALTITAPESKGIVGKDEVTITSGSYTITSKENAIRANDSVAIAGGSFTIDSEADGIHAENNDDDTIGNVYIEDGTFVINAGDDGIHATTTLEINGGSFDITAAEGLEATNVIINGGDVSIAASDDGINAAQKSSSGTPTVEINGGNITIVMGQGDTDGVDSNGDIVINGGTIDVTGNSTFDYDGSGVINGGTVIVNGEEVDTLPNQMMGGHGGNMGPGGMGDQGSMTPPDGMGGGKGPRPQDQASSNQTM